MYWVYESFKDRLFSLKGFPNQADAIAYADKVRDDKKSRGDTRHYEVHLGKQIIYTN